MIKTLKKRFILVNMALVSLVLVIAFSTVLFFNYQWVKGETNDVLRRALDVGVKMDQPAFEVGRERPERSAPMLPVFVVQMDTDGKLTSVFKMDVEISDTLAAQVAERALNANGREGVLFDLQLRYMKQDSPSGMNIAFADMGRETDSMANLLMTLLIVGLAGMAAFFLISLFLSGMALRPAEKAWEQQRRFVADASHELKTPLTVILANMDILLSHKQETVGEQSKWVENTLTEAERMKKLVEELLFLAKSDDGRTLPLKSDVDFSDAVWSSLLPFESIAYEHGVAISSDIAPGIMVNGDEGQLKQLVVILLDNACKYAGEHGAVSVRLERTQDNASLSVRNTGTPIPKEHLKHIFKRFYRAESSRAREQGGYGLGLSIARAVAEKHGGKIFVTSEEAAGTVFTVRLPLK